MPFGDGAGACARGLGAKEEAPFADDALARFEARAHLDEAFRFLA
jgi:hypothetical protein